MVVAAQNIGKGVFWLGVPDVGKIFGHLRRLGAARMPDGRIVYFRHYDSDVLATVAPLLNREQAAILFGPSSVFALIGGRGDGASVTKPDDLPEGGSYPISFEAWQISELDERQKALSYNKIARMLRQELPKTTKHITDNESLVKTLCREAMNESLKNESSQAKWCFMHYISNCKLNKDFLSEYKNSAGRESALTSYFAAFLRIVDIDGSIGEFF